MKTLDEVIKGMEHCHEDNCMECPYQFEPRDFDCITQCQYSDALHYLKAYRQLSRGLVGENTEIRPEGIYCKVCGTRLDKDWDDEDA